MPLVYDELRALARRRLRHGRDETLQTTVLVHEVYLKLAQHSRLEIHDRHHFFALAARAMRQLTVDYARRRAADKRGGGVRLVSAADIELPVVERAEQIVALDAALDRLAQLDAPLARVVELRYFGGLSVEETAGVLGCSARTVKRDWRKARAVLHAELTSQPKH